MCSDVWVQEMKMLGFQVLGSEMNLHVIWFMQIKIEGEQIGLQNAEKINVIY